MVVPLGVPVPAARALILGSFALLLTARGIRRGHHRAWLAAIALLLGSAALHMAKGVDVEEAVLATAGALWLTMHRDAFPVWASRSRAKRTLVMALGGAVVTFLVAIGLSATVGRAHRIDVEASPHSIAARIGADELFPLNLGGRFRVDVPATAGLGLLGSTL